jgi:hypothetical protein
MKFKKASIAIILLALSLVVEASVPAFESVKSAESLFMESMASESSDMTYASLALVRCSVLITVVESYLKNNSQDIDIADEGFLFERSLTFKVLRLTKINSKLTIDEASKEAWEEVKLQFKPLTLMYTERIKSNKLSSGDSWASDSKLQAEIEFCKNIGDILK